MEPSPPSRGSGEPWTLFQLRVVIMMHTRTAPLEPPPPSRGPGRRGFSRSQGHTATHSGLYSSTNSTSHAWCDSMRNVWSPNGKAGRCSNPNKRKQQRYRSITVGTRLNLGSNRKRVWVKTEKAGTGHVLADHAVKLAGCRYPPPPTHTKTPPRRCPNLPTPPLFGACGSTRRRRGAATRWRTTRERNSHYPEPRLGLNPPKCGSRLTLNLGLNPNPYRVERFNPNPTPTRERNLHYLRL